VAAGLVVLLVRDLGTLTDRTDLIPTTVMRSGIVITTIEAQFVLAAFLCAEVAVRRGARPGLAYPRRARPVGAARLARLVHHRQPAGSPGRGSAHG